MTETIPQGTYQTITPDHPAWIPGLEYVVWPEGAGLWPEGEPTIWARGRVDQLAATGWGSAVAVTGSRAATSYGLHVAGELGFDLASKVSAVVATSGFGIDSAALRGALASEAGFPVAVTSCGIDKSYPTAHEDLLDKIADRGVILSLFPPGTAVRRERFIATRIMLAAMCKAVLVVESSTRGGAMDVARLARRAGKPVFAVPGPITSAASTGSLDLLKEGQARICTGAADVLDVLDSPRSTPQGDAGCNGGNCAACGDGQPCVESIGA